MPTIDDEVVIPELAGNQVITFSTGSASVAKITSAEQLTVSGGTLTVNGELHATAGLTVSGGTLKSAQVSASTSLKAAGGSVDGVTLHGNLDATDNSSYLQVLNGLTLNGTATLGNFSTIGFTGSQTLGGTGTVVFQNQSVNGLISRTNGMTLTIGAGITVRGGSSSTNAASIGSSTYFSSGADTSLVIEGKIQADVAGARIRLLPSGTGTLTNHGELKITGGTLDLGGNFTKAQLGTINRTGGVINVVGTLDNVGNTLQLDAATGSWSLFGGKINGGTVTATEGSKLLLTSSGGTLDGVTLNGDLDATASSSYATIVNQLTLNGVATLGSQARLLFANTQTLNGTGTVVFQDFSNNALISVTNNMTLTIGADITVRGGASSNNGANIGGSLYWSSGANTSLVILGTINADTAGRSISLNPTGTGTVTNSGTIAINAGTLIFGGNVTVAGLGTINRNGGLIKLAGKLDNTGTTLALDAAMGTWNLAGGTILGGTVTTSGGAKLQLTSDGGTLDGVTIEGELDVAAIYSISGASFAFVRNGLTLNGTATIGERARLLFEGSQTLGGSGTVVFQNFQGNSLTAYAYNMTLTIGPNITVRGGSSFANSAFIGYSPSFGGNSNISLDLQGTIIADIPGRAILLNAIGTGTLTNTGTITVNGGTIGLGGNFTPLL